LVDLLRLWETGYTRWKHSLTGERRGEGDRWEQVEVAEVEVQYW
jgi:hypothetical protein